MGKRLALLIIISFLIVGCAPVNYERAGNDYLDQWLYGLRQTAIAECEKQPDPAQCRNDLRTMIDAIIPPEMQTDALKKAN